MLKPDPVTLRNILDGLGPGDLLQLELQTRELFARSVGVLRNTSRGDADLHALDVRLSMLPHSPFGFERGPD